MTAAQQSPVSAPVSALVTAHCRLTLADLPTPNFEIRVIPGDRRVRVAGEVDVATVVKLSDTVGAFLLASPGPLTIDLTDLTFIDLTGVDALLEIRGTQVDRQTELHLTGCGPRIARVFSLARLTGLLTHHDTQPTTSADHGDIDRRINGACRAHAGCWTIRCTRCENLQADHVPDDEVQLRMREIVVVHLCQGPPAVG